MDDASLTLESLKAHMASFHAALGSPSAPVVGIACGPHSARIIKDKAPRAESPFLELPMLIDPRMVVGHIEAYYDLGSWKERCKEQNAWDEGTAVAEQEENDLKLSDREARRDGCGEEAGV
jgi:hypothetical protein